MTAHHHRPAQATAGRAVPGPPADDALRGPFGSAGDPESARLHLARRLAAPRGGIASLDRLTALAARLLGARAAQVSVLADEQVVMGAAGVEAGVVGTGTPVADSLCNLTVHAAAPVAVADAVADERTRVLPPVTTGAVGSYLGVPLLADGHCVGALCVHDPEPRAWTDADVSLLEQLAGPALAELELAALETSHEEDRLLWQLAVDAAGVGAFDWELGTGELRWDERLLDLFGLDRTTFGGTIEAFNATVHPDDLDRVGQALAEAVETCGLFTAEYRILRPDGGVRWIGARGQALPGPDGTAVRVLGAAYDTTAERDGEARVARALEAMPTAFFHLDRHWRFTYANAEAVRLLGPVESGLVGHVVWELFPDSVGSDFERHYRGAAETGEPVAFEAHYPLPLDAWYEVRAWPTPDGLSVYFLDVTARHRAQQAVEASVRRASLLAEVTKALTDTLEGEEAAHRFAQLMVPALADWCVVTLVDAAGQGTEVVGSPGWRRRLRDLAWWHVDPEARPHVATYARVRVPALTEDSFVARALEHGEMIVLREAATNAVASVLSTEEARDAVRRLAPESGVLLPLQGRGRVAGVLSAFRGAGRAPFSEDDLTTLADAAARAGLALDNVRTFASQRDFTESLQRTLLTAPPQPDHISVAVRYEPASAVMKIGGDWYDAFVQPSGETVLAIGDVVGHDTDAAAAMGQLRGLLRGIAVTTGEGPADVLRRVDEAMATLEVETLATAVVARLEQTAAERETGTSRLRWSSAGHPPPVVVVPGDTRPGGAPTGPGATAELLWVDSHPMLGLDPTAARGEAVVSLPRGATALFYTDGLVERRGRSIDEGLGLLVQTLVGLVDEGVPLDELCDRLLRQMLPDSTEDDVALVAVRLHPQDRPRPAP